MTAPEQHRPQTPDVTALLALSAEMGRRIGALEHRLDALGAVVTVAQESVPGCDHASLSHGYGEERFRTLAASDTAASTADRLQYELHSGPCVEAAEHDRVVQVDDLATDSRWPVFGPRAAAEVGVHGVLSIRLVLDDVVAALNLYSDTAGAFGEEARTIATLVATHGAQAVDAVIAREQVGNLRIALMTNRTIGMAMGVLMSTYKILPDQAFDLLRIASQDGNRKLIDVAGDVIATGELVLPATSRRSGRRGA